MSLDINPIGRDIPIEPETPRIYSETYRHSIVDSVWQPEQSLLSEVEGRPRLCQYFRQFLNPGEEPKPFYPGNTDTYQSYVRIDRLPLKIDGDETFNFDPQTGESTKIFNFWFTTDANPIRHDVFIVDIGDGRAGLFACTEQPEIRNFTANKVYFVTAVLRGILDQETDTILQGRVVQHRVYSKDSVLHGGASLITKGEEEVGQKLFQWNQTIASHILKRFYWNPERTIVFDKKGTNEKDKVYDPYLVNFLTAFITPDMRQNYPPINQFSVQYGGLEYSRWGTNNIWEVLLRGDLNLLKVCDNKAALVEVTRLMNSRLYGNLSSSKIRWFVTTNPKDFIAYRVHFNMDGYPIVIPGKQEDITYLFSQGFYHGKPEGAFESLLYRTLTTKVTDHKELLAYCEGYFDKEPVEQLYEGAILLMLLKYARKFGGPL
ncbi:hypothetical protein [Pseudomonas aeruginosa]|uniref:hypothetical protein n=1 Tax=Pseudomonas aeruginosa TaxID=287 RepID=UPI00244A749B|nr:hypothetical protein [Pseudomonas aeruginosa]MDH1421257.1 hypothetical protein [Pseudomonas aeruginosa]